MFDDFAISDHVRLVTIPQSGLLIDYEYNRWWMSEVIFADKITYQIFPGFESATPRTIA